MATTAERQAAYRLRRKEGDGDKRLNTWIGADAALALERLASHNGITRRAMLEQLILAASAALTSAGTSDEPARTNTLASEDTPHE